MDTLLAIITEHLDTWATKTGDGSIGEHQVEGYRHAAEAATTFSDLLVIATELGVHL